MSDDNTGAQAGLDNDKLSSGSNISLPVSTASVSLSTPNGKAYAKPLLSPRLEKASSVSAV